MSSVTSDLEELLSAVHKTISDNRLFLEKLVDETVEDESDDEETTKADDDFEEL